MTTLFISDLHLDASRPHITRLFVEFVREEAVHADALYILGDLFEAWIGDDVEDDTADVVASALAGLHGRGVPCFYVHGNRDFLLGDAYARRARMTLLPDPSMLVVEGNLVLISHGDKLCTDDRPYQAFRAQSRMPEWQRGFLARSVSDRTSFAAQARIESARYTRSVEDQITDVNADAVLSLLATYRVPKLIHGHTHRPAIHSVDVSGRSVERIVLGDWYDHSSSLALQQNQGSSQHVQHP